MVATGAIGVVTGALILIGRLEQVGEVYGTCL